MTTASDFIEGTLDDYLVSLAEGLQEAQLQLSQLERASATGQPTHSYHLPQLDFELKLTVALNPPATSSAALQGRRTASRTAPRAEAPQLLFRPLTTATNSQIQTEAVSVIKGSFVAVPVNGGQPPPVIRCSLARGDKRETVVTVTLRNAAGEPLPGVEVHFNIDLDLSARLSGANPADFELAPDTVVVYGVRTSDENGQVHNVLRISEKEEHKFIVALVIDALGRSEVVIAGGETR